MGGNQAEIGRWAVSRPVQLLPEAERELEDAFFFFVDYRYPGGHQVERVVRLR